MSAIRLRTYRESDVPDLLETWRDGQMIWWSIGPSDEAGALEWVAKRNDRNAGDQACWAVTDDTDRLLGSVSLHHIEQDQRTSQIGYWVSPWGRGRGVASTAVRMALAYGFGELDLHRVMLYHAVENPASCGVARRAGFRLEGETRLSYLYADGEFHDEHLHAILAAEFSG